MNKSHIRDYSAMSDEENVEISKFRRNEDITE